MRSRMKGIGNHRVRQKFLVIIFVWALCLVNIGHGFSIVHSDEGTESDEPTEQYEYPIMKPDKETKEQWKESYETAPVFNCGDGASPPKGFGDGSGANVSLLSHLDYIPAERDQGSCGNCWAWAGTGALGIALDVEEGIQDRLSVQYLNSCQFSIIGKPCCEGGWLSNVSDFYNTTKKAIPWSNDNASWQSGDGSCGISCGAIDTSFYYPIELIHEETILTQEVTNETAIENIKNVLNENRAVWFGFFLPTQNDWSVFYNFWGDGNETDVWNPDYSLGHTWDSGGGGHAVLCVGYNDTDPENSYWIMLNSWGTEPDRPHGLFRVDMNMNCSGYHYDPYPTPYYSFYWQTLNVTFGEEYQTFVNTTIFGYVNDSTGLPLSGINVSAYNETEQWTNYSLSNETGYYEFEIFAGSFNITAERQGHIEWFLEGSYGENETHWINITLPAEEEQELPFINTTICGYVNDTEGVPVIGANVSAYNDTHAWSNFSLTNETGWYEFEIFAGNFTLTVELEQQVEWEQVVLVEENQSYMINISIEGGGESSSSNGTVSGYILREDTLEGIADATVEIHDTSSEFTNSTQTNAEGYYIFTQLDSGTYDLVTFKEGEFSETWFYGIILGENETVNNTNITVFIEDGGEELLNVTIYGYVYQDMTPDLSIVGANVTVRTGGIPTDILNYTLTDEEGYYELVFEPNQSAIDLGYNQIEVFVTADGYEPECESRDFWWMIDDMGGVVEMNEFRLIKIWDTNATIIGSVRDLSTGLSIANVSVNAEGENFFWNMTQTNETGQFRIGTITGEVELFLMKQGYFINCTEDLEIVEGANDVGVLYLEQKPAETAHITGNLTCNGEPLAYTEFVLYDPLHPFESEKPDLPRTNETGWFNISTYPGDFYLLTLAKTIGKRRDGPPLAVGGYENQIITISVGEYETNVTSINLIPANPDVINAQITFNTWNQTTVNMSRLILGNGAIIRLMADTDLDGTITAEEEQELIDMVNGSLEDESYFEMELQFLSIPLYYYIDSIPFQISTATVEFANLTGSSSATDPITLFINETASATNIINDTTELHSTELYGYYSNPAFETTYTIHLPENNISRRVKQILFDVDGTGTSTMQITPHQDPNWNDTSFYEQVFMLAGPSESTIFTEFNDAYYTEMPFDDDSDSDYDYLISKVKFNTTQPGTFRITGTLRGPRGISITDDTREQVYSTNSMVEFSFSGERIYRKKINGPYQVVADLYYEQGDTYIWFDSVTHATAEYNTSEFNSPPIYFTGEISDYGVDETDDGLYDYLVFALGVDVGEPGHYEFEGDLGLADFSFEGDPHITHVCKTVSFIDPGEQTYNLKFGGSMIYEKGSNSSLWMNVRVRSFTEGELDEFEHMTEKYYYADFSPPLPESCQIYGNVTDAYGNPVEAQIRLIEEETHKENYTSTNATTGEYSIQTKPGIYQFEIWCTNGSYSVEDHHEVIVIGSSDVNESIERNIMLIPFWHECQCIDWWLDKWQYATGEKIHLNITSPYLQNSNATLEVYKEYRVGDEYYGEQFITAMTVTTNENGTAYFIINTSDLSNGQYMIQMIVANQSLQGQNVARGDLWGLQISSLELDFDIDKDRYKPDGDGQGSYTLTYISNGNEVVNATYEWKIMYWDWMGEHVLASDSFTNEDSGNGTFSFSIPSNILTYGDWFDLRFTATDPQENEVQSWRGFGITTGSVIESVQDIPVGTSGNYDGLRLNVTVNVTQSGTYRINSGLHDESWWFITGNETEQYLTAGTHIVPVFFEGDEIQSSGRSGTYRAWVGLFRSGEWEELDGLEYTCSQFYSANDFSQPEVRFNTTEALTYYAEGETGDYDALIVNTSIIASIPGNYTIHGNLHSREEQPGGWYEWHHVAWGKSENVSFSGGDLNTTKDTSIRFEGAEIYNSEREGPYYVNFNLHRVQEGEWEEWITSYDPEDSLPYTYTQFSKPSAYISTITDYGPDAEGNLIIGVLVNVSENNNGTYQIFGNLHSSHEQGFMWITDTWNCTDLEDNTSTIVNLTFSGNQIYSAGYDGPYNLHTGLEKLDPHQWLGGKEFETDEHSYTDFSEPSALFTGEYHDCGYDEDDDGLYDAVLVTAIFNVTEGGTYEISGDLYQEDGWDWHWITWGHEELEINTSGRYNLSIAFSGNEILKSGLEGQYGVTLWLREIGQGVELGQIDLTTETYYYLDDFGQPSVRFTEESPLDDSLSDDGKEINITLAINASEIGTYHINGHMHKVIPREGWDEWIWIAFAGTDITITELGETEVNLSFDTAMVQGPGYDGPYTIDFELMDDSWQQLDFIHEYTTQGYSLESFASRPAYFADAHTDYLYPTVNPEYVKVQVQVQVNESGTYHLDGDIHKENGYNWNFIAGSGIDQYLNEGLHNVTLQFDAVEILDNIDTLGLSEFNDGSTFDIDVWLRREGEWSELDHTNFVSEQIYSISNFSSFSGGIIAATDNGYNESGTSSYEYLNVTVTVNFTSTGNYELWCDLSKELEHDWYWIGWKNQFITVSDTGEQNITLQFSGERISSAGYNGPYELYMELQNRDTGRRISRYDGETAAYSLSDFVGSSVEFNDTTASALAVDTDDSGSEYNYLQVDVNVTATESCNVELRGDLHKESEYGGWQWISCMNEWTSIAIGNNELSLSFDGELIRSSELDGPYQIRFELWDTDNWNLLDAIDIESPAYSYENFQAPGASLLSDQITDWGLDTDVPTDDSYDFLELNVSVDVATEGTYEIMGDLHSDTNSWHWLGWGNNFTELSAGTQTVKLQFSGIQIRNKEVNGPYKVRIELRDDTGRMLSMVDPYETSTYSYDDFEASDVQLISADDRIVGDDGDYLELNVSVDCSTAGTYWVGADLHKEDGWEWQWISWESTETMLTGDGEQNMTILFSGEIIRNSQIDGPYQIRIELRDTDTWTEQDVIERYVTDSYTYTQFKQPSVSFGDIEDWGNDTNSDDLYNYLELNITINCSRAGTYWLNADLHKQSNYNWQWISWKGEEVSLTGDGEQEIKLQFDGERIYSSEIDGPYQIHLELSNTSTWTRLDTYDQYTTQSYSYDDFQRASAQFLENDTSPSDRGVGTEGSYTSLEINVTIDSDSGGNYWLQADLHKESNYNWQWIAWKGQEITHSSGGNETFSIVFDGSQIRNRGINGPYQVRLELCSATGEWRQFDVIERYTTESYDATDFQSAGIELVDADAGAADTITGGNLQINVTINSSTTGIFEIMGDLHKESSQNWQWISWNSTQVTVSAAGEQTFPLLFEGGAIYEKGIDGPYHVYIELRNIGTGSTVDTIDRYTTNSYHYNQFSVPSAGINVSEISDYAPDNQCLQLNVTTYTLSSGEYKIDAWLHGENWEFIAWNKTSQTINGYNQVVEVKFDGSIINNSGIDPEKVYIEMRRMSDWKLIDDDEYALQGEYAASDFGAAVEIHTDTISCDVWDEDGNGYNDSLNITVDVSFDTSGTYELSAGLRAQSGEWIIGTTISPTHYSGLEEITLSFDGLKIYKKGVDGNYSVSYIAISREESGEIARETNIFTTPAYLASNFEHPDINEPDGEIIGNYSSYVVGEHGNYTYLVINVTINATVASFDYDVYADLYSSDGSTWIAGDSKIPDVEMWEGEEVIQLYVEGDDIYDSLTNGPYLLGLIRFGAEIGGEWMLLDKVSNAYTTTSYTYSDFTSEDVAPMSPSGASSITVSNDPFSPNDDGTRDTTLITVTATEGQTLYLNIYDNNSNIKRTGMPLSGSGTSYTATWQGLDNDGDVVADGTYRIKVSDGAHGDQGNEAAIGKTVVVDNTAPTSVTLLINNDDEYTNSTSVTLSIGATDNSTKKMQVRNSGGNWPDDWEDFSNSKDWVLSSTDGTKTVQARVKDVTGNIATAVSDSIKLDTTKPSNVNITITGKGDTPSTHTNDRSVSLTMSADDATSGVEYMMVANDISFTDRTWETYAESKEWTLTSSDGTKTVYLKVKDRAGKVSDIVSDTIVLDTQNPTELGIQINSDQTYTNSTTVTLTLSATGAAKMAFSNTGTSWSSWESYSTEKTGWALSSTEGVKTVYFKAKDTAGNVATQETDTINLDTSAPTISSVTHSGTTQTSATITWTTNEGSTSYVEYGQTTSYGAHTTLSTTKVTSHSQTITGLSPGTTYHYRVKSRDSAGNLRTSTDSSFSTASEADTTPPAAISGLTVTDKASAEKTLVLSWTQSSASDFAGYKIYRKTASFSNVSASGVQLLTTITSKTTTTYQDTSATDDTEYYYAVTAIDTATPPNENQTVTSVAGTSVDDKAPTTTSNIPGGWQTTAVTVTLTATDNGKGVNKTYYTTDGTSPKTSPTRVQYTSPFTVGGDNPLGDGVWTIKYYSYDKNTTPNIESIHTATLKVDTESPVTIDNAPTGWQNSAVSIVLTPSDDTSGIKATYYTKNGNAPTIASPQYSSSIVFTSDGTYTLKYFSEDNSSNDEDIKTKTIQLDAGEPTVIITYNLSRNYYKDADAVKIYANFTESGSGINESSVQITINTSGTDVTAQSMEKSDNTHYYYEWDVPTGSEGAVNVSICAEDNASNPVTGTSWDTSKTIDNTAPSVSAATITAPDGGETVSGNYNITWTTTGISDDNLETSPIILYYSNTSGTSWTLIASGEANDGLYMWNTSSLSYATTYLINITAQDKAGNSGYDTSNATFTLDDGSIDNDAPSITDISATPSSQDASGYVNITCAVTDNVAVNVVKINITDPDSSTINTTMPGGGTYYYNTTYTTIGQYSYYIWANDTSGNSNTSSTSTFTIAGINISALSQEYYKRNDTVYINGSVIPAQENKWIGIEVRDVANQEIYYNQTQTNSTGCFSISFVIGLNDTISDGTCTVYASYDSTRDNRTFIYDGTKPSSTVSNPSHGAKLNALDTINGTSSDGTTSVLQVEIQILFDGAYWNGSAWSATETWLLATGTTNWTYDSSAVAWVLCCEDANITIRSRAADTAGNVETPGSGNIWTYSITTTITTTADNIGAYHGFNITWQDVGMPKYKIYYNTTQIDNISELTAKATVTGTTTYQCYDMPSDTWGETIFFAVTTVDENDIEAGASFVGESVSSRVWAYKMEITGVEEITSTEGEIGWEMHYKNRFLNGSLSGKAILECLGPGANPTIPNMPQWVSRSSMSITAFLETGQKDSYVSKTYEAGDYKGWNMLWSCLPSEGGYWEAYAELYECKPITVEGE